MLQRILNIVLPVLLIGQLPLLITGALTNWHPIVIGCGMLWYVALLVTCAIGNICDVDGYADGPVAGPLAAILACGVLLTAPSIARAEADCLWSGTACSDGSMCIWDIAQHGHRCTATDRPGFPVTLWPCELQQELVCVADRPVEHRACLRAVQEHNATCTRQRQACSEAATMMIADYCRTAVYTMQDGYWSLRIPNACTEAIRVATNACTPTRDARSVGADNMHDAESVDGTSCTETSCGQYCCNEGERPTSCKCLEGSEPCDPEKPRGPKCKYKYPSCECARGAQEQ